MKQRIPSPDPVETALARRRVWHRWLAAAGVGLVGSSVLSHALAPADAAVWDARPGVVCDGVLDGNTIAVHGPAGDRDVVRLRGIEAMTPPTTAPTTAPADEPTPTDAARVLNDRLVGKAVTLKFDGTEKRDVDRHLLAYAYLTDSDCVNVDQVRDGYAYVDRRVKSVLQNTLDDAETTARKRGTGLWKNRGPSDMPAWRQAWLDSITHRPAK